VARERLKSPRARLFVAVDLPERVRDRLAAWQQAECVDQALRPVAPQALHVTLCFLGYHPERLIARIAELLASVETRPCELRFRREPVALPATKPRLFAAEAESPATVELQAALVRTLVDERLYEIEKRPFWPHVTVARVRAERVRGGRSGRRRGEPRRLERAPGPLPDALLEPFSGVRLALYRSILKPQGAEYVSLAGVDLPPAEGDRRGD